MIACVVASKDIVTTNGLTIARKDDTGRAESGLKPHEPNNWGKVLVYWNGRTHGYWCDPAAVRFKSDKFKMEDFIATRIEFNPYKGAPVLPKSTTEYVYDFGKNLKIIRESRKISQAALGTRMGNFGVELAQSTICYRESCPDSPSGSFVKAAAKALDVPPFIFFVDLKDSAGYNAARQFLSGISSSLCEG